MWSPQLNGYIDIPASAGAQATTIGEVDVDLTELALAADDLPVTHFGSRLILIVVSTKRRLY